ncbi:hypothetical protein BB561_000445 [Smittium simulii]|uniref:Protein kinase domain-containing protein n=1 Tax=Smittium simulii TaxID=133385 RepID=A0A2T9YZ87_9FUNG|nr:hypothetical protein BB561_000445 [Smittium simulii]
MLTTKSGYYACTLSKSLSSKSLRLFSSRNSIRSQLSNVTSHALLNTNSKLPCHKPSTGTASYQANLVYNANQTKIPSLPSNFGQKRFMSAFQKTNSKLQLQNNILHFGITPAFLGDRNSRLLHKNTKTNHKQKKAFYKRQGFWASIAIVGLLMELGDHYKVDYDFYITAFSRCFVAFKASSKVVYQYYINFPDLLSDEEALADPEKNQRILEIRSEIHTRCAKIIRQAMMDNGGVYIKFGQHISAMSYILPNEWVNVMKPLQDMCSSSTIEQVSQVFEAEMGKTLDQEFIWFDPVPIGTASLAQVHKAKSKSTGQVIAVKIQHPDVRTFSLVDIFVVTEMFKLIYKVFPEFEFMWLADEMSTSLPLESDFTVEAENAKKLARNFNKKTDISMVVPKIIASTHRVLIMEFIDGVRVDNLEYLKQHKISPVAVSREIAKIFGEMIFNDGFVHCDPHPGNIFIRKAQTPTGKNFEIVMLDHGLYRTLQKEFIIDYAKLWRSLLKGNEKEIRDISFKLTGNDLYEILSTLVTGRSWKSVSSGNLSTSSVYTKFGKEDLVGSKDSFYVELSQVMSSIPRDLVLVTKTNDLIRLIDRSLFKELSARALDNANLF